MLLLRVPLKVQHWLWRLRWEVPAPGKFNPLETKFWWRVTRYDPDLRNEHGHWQLHDWTNACEIGRTFTDGGLLTASYYESIESYIVEAIIRMAEEAGLESLTVANLDVGGYKRFGWIDSIFFPVQIGDRISLNDAAALYRLHFRGSLNCYLDISFEDVDTGFYWQSSYDGYTHVGTPNSCEKTREWARDKPVFIERERRTYVDPLQDRLPIRLLSREAYNLFKEWRNKRLLAAVGRAIRRLKRNSHYEQW